MAQRLPARISRKVAGNDSWERNSNDFVFDCEFLVQAAAFGFRLAIFRCRRATLRKPLHQFPAERRYGLESLRSVIRYHLHI